MTFDFFAVAGNRVLFLDVIIPNTQMFLYLFDELLAMCEVYAGMAKRGVRGVRGV